jgi:ribosome-associated protein
MGGKFPLHELTFLIVGGCPRQIAFQKFITLVETGYLVITKASLTSRKLAKLVAGFASDKKAQDVIILDMRTLVNFCDYFVVCSGNTGRQVQAIADHIDEQLCTIGLSLRYKQGLKNADWVIFDSGDVVVHIFQKDVREFYGLEHLWQEAKKVKFNGNKS